MTIAAGFVCRDGVVLCADTELTATYKQQGPKLWLHSAGDLSVAVTGAGDYVLLKTASERIQRGLVQGMSPDDVLGRVIEPTATYVYETHVDKAPPHVIEAGYYLSLLVAIQVPGDVRLYESERTGVALVSGYSAKGSADIVGNTIAGTLFSGAMSVIWGQVLAAYLIQQSKTFGTNAGGGTQIVVLPRTEPARQITAEKVGYFEDAATWLHETVGGLLMAVTDTRGGDLKPSIVALAKAADTIRVKIGLDHISGYLERHSAYRAAHPPVPRDRSDPTDGT